MPLVSIVSHKASSSKLSVCVPQKDAAKLGACAQRCTVELVDGGYPTRDIVMANRATSVIAVLPQFGGGQSGALIAVLKESTDPTGARAKATLDLIRVNSEPYDQKFADLQAVIYEAWYASKADDWGFELTDKIMSAMVARHKIPANNGAVI